MLKWFKNNKGISLIESTLAIVIVSTALLAGLSLLQGNVIASVQYEKTTIASHLANEKLEGILADKEFLGYSYATNTSNYPTEILSDDFTGFTREVIITEVDATDLTTPQTGSGLNKIDIVVTWSNNSQVTISTLVADI
jgi:type II secretory pathway pseudopilin PulG